MGGALYISRHRVLRLGPMGSTRVVVPRAAISLDYRLRGAGASAHSIRLRGRSSRKTPAGTRAKRIERKRRGRPATNPRHHGVDSWLFRRHLAAGLPRRRSSDNTFLLKGRRPRALDHQYRSRPFRLALFLRPFRSPPACAISPRTALHLAEAIQLIAIVGANLNGQRVFHPAHDSVETRARAASES